MDSNINSAWSAASALLKNKFSFNDIKQIVSLAGFDPIQIDRVNQGDKGQLVTKIEREFWQFDYEKKHSFLNIVIEEMLERQNAIQEQLENYLSRLGWQVIDGAVIPIKLLDKNDLEELDEVSREDLIKSAKRFRDGDLSGAVSAACGAVDSITNKIYQDKNLGDATNASFQQRCTEALKAVGIFSAISTQLEEIEWKDSGVIPFKKNFEGSLNQAAYIMQSLRANMSDVHGTKPVLKPLVFDSIKWSQILVRLLSGQYDT
ncbi:MAG: hypothetical protein ACXW0Q_13670 [Methylovulum sp.]